MFKKPRKITGLIIGALMFIACSNGFCDSYDWTYFNYKIDNQLDSKVNVQVTFPDAVDVVYDGYKPVAQANYLTSIYK